jgi:predicted aminopeptidase
MSQDVKAWGAGIGLSATHNYDTLALGWEHELQVVTGCQPLSFEAHSTWFPIVGRITYLGYFQEKSTERAASKLRESGLDVYVRGAGAWSSLGFFRDPLLPGMLRWSRFDLAETVLHELAHATVWIPGSATFNESFAGFVGEEAAFRYYSDRYGADSLELRLAREEFADLQEWRRLQENLYQDLEALYQQTELPDHAKTDQKKLIFEQFPEKVRAARLHDPQRFERAAREGTWNNARLVQFRTYNDRRPIFEARLAACDGDLLRFMWVVGEVARGQQEPWQALGSTVGCPAPSPF